MIIQTKYVLLLVTFAVAERQIKLEEIERDNLLSERMANQDEEIVNIGQSQHLTASNGAPTGYASPSESAENDLGEDIVYAQPPTAPNEQYKIEQQPSVQYVTPQQFEKEEYDAKPTTASFTHPVHEATHTYSAPSRQSLVSPIVFKTAASPSPYLSQQPKFVYVQAGPQQVSQNGVITYGQPQHSAENVIQTQQKNAQDDVHYASIEQNHITETSPQSVNAQSRQVYASRAIQYYPFLSHAPSIPNYVMLFRSPTHTQAYAIQQSPSHTQAYAIPQSPSHTQAFAIPQIQYSQPTALLPSPEQEQAPPQQQEHVDQPASQEQVNAAQPTVATSYVNPTVEGTALLPAPEAPHIPAATIQYALPQLQYATQPLHLQPVPPPQLHHSHQYYPSPLRQHQQHFPSPIDIYHSLQKHQPTSLLDSYIPSSVILAAQRQRSLFNRQMLHAVPGNFASPTLPHPSSIYYQQGSHQAGYNTIAYSTAQGYSKRSSKLTTERPLKLTNKRN